MIHAKPSALKNRGSSSNLITTDSNDSDEDEKDSPVMYKTAAFCLMQGCSSVSLMILNKYMATFFSFPILTLIAQNGVATVLSVICCWLGFGPSMQRWKRAHFVKILPMSALFTILLYTSFRTMGHLSIATVVVFRNAGPLFTAVAEYFLRGETFSQNSLVALCMMIVGGLVYGLNDLHFNTVGYMWASFNLVCNTAAGLYGKHLTMDLKSEQTGLGLACYQNITSVPMFLVVALLTGESSRWGDLGTHGGGEAVPHLVIVSGLLSCLACTTMGVSTFELQRLVSQATVAVANVSYKLVTLMVGALVFGNNMGFMGFIGLCIAQISAILYVYERQFSTNNKSSGKASPAPPAPPPPPKIPEYFQLTQRDPGEPKQSNENV